MVATRSNHLVTEEGTRLLRLLTTGPGRTLRCGAVTRRTGTAALAVLAEQLPEETHGRFPSHETDPPVGQDRPSIRSLATSDILT
jgi:hypothetical protein